MINDPQITQIAQMADQIERNKNPFPSGFIKAGSSLIFLR